MKRTLRLGLSTIIVNPSAVRLDKADILSLNRFMSVLTIQSRVASGYVGNSAAVPCLQQYGLDCLSVDTVHFSNHPAHGRHRGRQVPPNEIDELVAGISERGILGQVQAIQSGYLGISEIGQVVLDAVGAVKRVSPSAPYVLDPVMGDNGLLYV